MRRLVALLICLAATAASAVGVAQQVAPAEPAAEPQRPVDAVEPATYGLEDGDLVIMRAGAVVGRIEVPCQPRELLVVEPRAYVACGVRGVWTASVADPTAPVAGGFHSVGAPVSGLFVAEGRVWATVERVEARPLGQPAPAPGGDEAGPAEPVAAAEPEPAFVPRKSRPVGEVVEAKKGRIVVSIGSAHGVDKGDRVELFVEEMIDLGAGEEAIRERRLAVGRVTAASATRAQVSLGMNERVPVEALARPTTLELTGSATLPPRLGDIWEARAIVRPFLALGTLGAGGLGQASLTYRFEWPGAIEASLNPIGIGLADEGNMLSTGGEVSGSYDTEAFRIGGGLGYINRKNDWEAVRGGEAIYALAITQIARLGARDGLHVRANNAFLLASDQFMYAGTDVMVQIPMESYIDGTWLIARGGGHISGDAYGEVGLRVLVIGNGDRGSLFVMPTLGAAWLSQVVEKTCTFEGGQGPDSVICHDQVAYGGPSLGFGIEWRF